MNVNNLKESFIYGKNAIIEALESGTRTFNKIMISSTIRSDEKIQKIKKLSEEKGIVYQFVNREKLNQMAQESSHQGVIAFVSPISYENLDDFIAKHADKLTSVLILDGIEDAHNLGAIIRTAVCAGVKGIILPARRSVLITLPSKKQVPEQSIIFQ